MDRKYVKLAHGERGVLLTAMGVTPGGERAVLDVTLAEEDKRNYWGFASTLVEEV